MEYAKRRTCCIALSIPNVRPLASERKFRMNSGRRRRDGVDTRHDAIVTGTNMEARTVVIMRKVMDGVIAAT